jgi:Rrf2 family protein
MLWISSQEEMGLRFLVRLAQQPDREVALADISQVEGISLQYVRKIFGILGRNGLVRASRGVKGGYWLVKPAAEISLVEIFDALKPVSSEFDCSQFSGKLPVCANHDNCSVRPVIQLLDSKVRDFLAGISLSQLAQHESEVIDSLRGRDATTTLDHEPTKQVMQS